ncbi:TetR family transcriptional regulator [Streptomyces lunaelactis]|uniref:TetR family transcriptional regulator n=1 Tax=Streptomyces lunaelactis TaxID=1535768 RepID=UPI0015859B08|nr:TetR family transcriptional regulator [Streptomyces lunaelactis]NUK16953.1 TetR/AcrR family transcriptional regulator [Streptomyces lunaelactis]
MTEEIRTTTGRPIGARGLKTRSQLLLCLKELLAESGYHATRVIDVARRARTSPATFYQYFADVDAAVLELARPAAQQGSDGLIYAEIGSWWGGGRRAAGSTVDAVFAFWQEHEVVLRVVDLRAAEGDSRFTEIRRRALSGLLGHLEYAITTRPSSPGATDDSFAAAEALTVLLAAAAGRHAPEAADPTVVRQMLVDLITLAVSGGTVVQLPTA